MLCSSHMKDEKEEEEEEEEEEGGGGGGGGGGRMQRGREVERSRGREVERVSECVCVCEDANAKRQQCGVALTMFATREKPAAPLCLNLAQSKTQGAG